MERIELLFVLLLGRTPYPAPTICTGAMIRQLGVMTPTAVKVHEDSTQTGKVVLDPAANPCAGPVHRTGCSAPYLACSGCARSPHTRCQVGGGGTQAPLPTRCHPLHCQAAPRVPHRRLGAWGHLGTSQLSLVQPGQQGPPPQVWWGGFTPLFSLTS